MLAIRRHHPEEVGVFAGYEGRLRTSGTRHIRSVLRSSKDTGGFGPQLPLAESPGRGAARAGTAVLAGMAAGATTPEADADAIRLLRRPRSMPPRILTSR